MKVVYILIVLVIAALTLGCIGNKQTGTSTNAPVSPVETSITPDATPIPTVGDDAFGTDADVTTMDSMLSDLNLDTSLSDAI